VSDVQGVVEVRLVFEDTGVAVSRELDWHPAPTSPDHTWSATIERIPAGGARALVRHGRRARGSDARGLRPGRPLRRRRHVSLRPARQRPLRGLLGPALRRAQPSGGQGRRGEDAPGTPQTLPLAALLPRRHPLAHDARARLLAALRHHRAARPGRRMPPGRAPRRTLRRGRPPEDPRTEAPEGRSQAPRAHPRVHRVQMDRAQPSRKTTARRSASGT
jgi:hypothetical protein